MWEIAATDQFAAWYAGRTVAQAVAINAAIDALEANGPALGRPF